MPFLLHVLLFTLCLGALHLGMSARASFSAVRFCAAAAAAHLVVGLLVAMPALQGQASRSWTTAWWAPVQALGLLATGVVLGAAWLGVVRGLEWLIQRRRVG